MRPEIRRRLCVPTALAVSTVSAAPGCKDGDRTTTDAASETSDTSTTTDTTTGTTTGPTTGGETDTDGVPDCRAIEDRTTCEATPLCIWPDELVMCTVDCMKITDERICGTQLFCFWSEGKCELVII